MMSAVEEVVVGEAWAKSEALERALDPLRQRMSTLEGKVGALEDQVLEYSNARPGLAVRTLLNSNARPVLAADLLDSPRSSEKIPKHQQQAQIDAQNPQTSTSKAVAMSQELVDFVDEAVNNFGPQQTTTAPMVTDAVVGKIKPSKVSNEAKPSNVSKEAKPSNVSKVNNQDKDTAVPSQFGW